LNPDDASPGGLMADASVPADVPGQGRSPERRQLSFRTSGLVIELEITGSGESRRLAGRLIPGQSGVVEIRGVVTVEADALGRFSVEEVPPGQVSLRCRLGTQAAPAQIATGWVAL
jgi:hypothetical protein